MTVAVKKTLNFKLLLNNEAQSFLLSCFIIILFIIIMYHISHLETKKEMQRLNAKIN